jgi:hypothetical protein
MNKCKNCKKECKRKGKIYCSNACQTLYRKKVLINKWLQGEHPGCTKNKYRFHRTIREWLIAQCKNKCPKCGWSEVNPVTKKVPLEINHKDGDSTNHSKNNVEVLCPNCHSLTPNYKSLNNNHGRTYRRRKWKTKK